MKTEQSCDETPVTLREIKDLTLKPARGEEDAPEKQDESKYVDVGLMDSMTDGANPEQSCCSGEISLVCVFNDGALCATDTGAESKQDAGAVQCAAVVKDSSSDPTTSSVPQSPAKSEEWLGAGHKGACVTARPEAATGEDARRDVAAGAAVNGDNLSESDDLDEDDDVSSVLSDDCVPCAIEDESHYITTHEIQLCELSDHEPDYEPGAGSSASWDMEDNNQVYSFVDYASFDGDGAVGERGAARRPRSRGAAAGVSTLLESDPCDASKFTSSDESVSKPQRQHQQQQQQQGSGRQIHLSIRTTSRAINDPGSIQEQENILYHARRSGDMSRYVLRGVDGKTETLCDRAKCFIAAPGRLHFGRIRGRELTEGSSGESSAVSELDDADKEVRTLTARAFKSLAYPYFDAINFTSSSESSASERGIGINTWSTFVDLKYGNVNMSRGLDQSVVSRQNNRASFEIAKNIENRGHRGIALASTKPPTSKIFTLNGPHRASSSTKQLELVGQFAQGHSGVIRLTETLNFRCNVNSGMSGGERRSNFAQNPVGSRSADEVTNNLPGGQRRGASKPHSKAMEGAQKKAIFASSLIKNVISKKMQFEQERKMERGEISEPHQTPSLCLLNQDSDGHRGKGSREPHRQSSRFSESGSDCAIMCVDEFGDFVDSGSCDTRSDARRRDSVAPAPETNLEPPNEAGIDAKKGALDACRSTLLRSQNSAFRCWKDEELEFQTDHKNDQTPHEKPPAAKDNEAEDEQRNLTKMSHLFVPSIQLLPSDGQVGQQLQNRNYSACGDECGTKLPPDSAPYAADSKAATTSKSPEIKINLRSIRDNKIEPFGVSKLRAPNIGCNAATLSRADDSKCQALAAALRGESSDKVPHFLVRDIRDNKGKLQTPIHQVRDVRKLVKSSYHFVSLDNNDNKSNAAESHPEQKRPAASRNPASVSPIVIKCQSVNTNNHGKQSGSFDLTRPEQSDADRSSPEGARGAPPQRGAERAPLGAEGSSSDETASRKQEKMLDMTDKKPESKVLNQVALEKLQAAVKTMEQLYVFEKNEWKRKNEPLPLTDSHVLSLIASEEHGGPEEDGAKGPADKTFGRDSGPGSARTPPAAAAAASPGADGPLRPDRDPVRGLHTSGGWSDRLVPRSLQTSSTSGSKNMFSLSSSPKTTTSTKMPNVSTQTPSSGQNLQRSLKTPQTRPSGSEGAEWREVDRPAQEPPGPSADGENYLTIPVKSRAGSSKQPPAEKASAYTFNPRPTTPPGPRPSTRYQEDFNSRPTTPPGPRPSTRVQEDFSPTAKRSSIVMETCSPEIPSATIYHSLPLGMSPGQPHVYCFSPAITPTPTLDPFQATQRKMLLDPSTGNYYLVDTPVQPTTKRLFDPETGQYVDVPIPQPPMTPMSMPISPLALSPGAYGHTYMIYPGFMPAPQVIPARALVQSQMSVQSETDSGEKTSAQQTEGLYMESPFYMATGKSPRAASRAQQQAAPGRPPPSGSGVKQPVISITSQQGPRIIAPPSFDGTTMSFVVEHR